MSECFNSEMREQIPELAADTLEPAARAEMEAHVAGCAACREELELLRAVRAAQIPVPFMNVSQIVRALPPAPVPVREELPWYRRASLQMAAALLLVAGGLISVRQAGDRVAAPTREVAVAAPPAVQDEAQTQAVASAVPTAVSGAVEKPAVTPARSTDISLVAGLDEMTADELTTLLKDVEGLAAVPVSEPEQFSPVTSDLAKIGEG